MRAPYLHKIVSGGQTGVDRAALDTAISLGIDHGGWCPRGRRAEDGRIPNGYRLKETSQRDYSIRTEQNVIDSDGTLILYRHQTTGGTELTRKLALKHHRPLLCIDLEAAFLSFANEVPDANSVDHDHPLIGWFEQHQIQTLNIAGPRESTCPAIARQAQQFLLNVLKPDISPEG